MAKQRSRKTIIQQDYGVSEAQATLLLRALDAEGYEHKGALYDREETFNILKERGFFEHVDMFTEEQREVRRQQAKNTAKKAKELLPDEWEKACEMLNGARQHVAHLDSKYWRLTEKGVKLARMMKDAGYTYDRLRYRSD